MKRTPTMIEVFAGVGGCSLAAARVGFRPVWACEWDQAAADVYELNHGFRPAGDIWGIDPAEVPDHELCMAGIPCQGFSLSGDKLGWDDPREWVLHPLIRLLEAKMPACVVVENVRGLRDLRGGEDLRLLKGWLRAIGYTVRHGLLNATEFGGCQFRQRLFVVASLRGQFRFDGLKKWNRPPGRLRDILERKVPDNLWLDPSKYVLLDKPTITKNGMVFAGYLRGKKWRPGWTDPRYPGTHQEMCRIYSDEGVGRTLMTHAGRYWVMVRRGVRRVTPLECVLLMGYPEDFRWPHPEGQRQQLGNSVHVPTVEALVKAIKEQLLGG